MSNDLPHNAEAEVWLLGSVFQDPKIMAQFADELNPADFYGEKNQLVWQAMKLLQKRNEPIDIITVSANIKQTNMFNSLFGNNDYLFSLMEAVSSAANADYYVELVRDCASKRKLIAACNSAIKDAMDPASTASHCLDSALDAISGIAKKSCRAAAELIGGTAWDTLKAMAESKRQGIPSGIKTSFYEIDEIIGGLRKSELVIVGARPGVGKTSFALDVAINAAVNSGTVLFFSLEMSREQLASRAMCYYSQVSLKRTVDGHLDMDELGRQENAANLLLKKVPLYSLYERDLTARQICSIAHYYAARQPLSLIVIDHLQIVNTSVDRKNYENRNIAIGEATRLFKILSGKLNCNVMVLSQLNRDMENRTGGKPKPPRLSDLRDSGNIEQDADCVMLIHRIINSEFHDARETTIIVAKNRSGPTGEAKIHFNTENAMFTGLDYSYNQGGLL